MGSARTLSFALGLVLLFLTRPTDAMAGGEIVGVPEIISGDELVVAGTLVRLAEIDAPDLAQRCVLGKKLYNCGEIARAALLDLTAGAKVHCKAVDRKPQGHWRGWCYAEGYNLSEGMVYTGWALAEPDATALYAHKQAEAERKNHGLWRGRFVAPWDWANGTRLPEEKGPD